MKTIDTFSRRQHRPATHALHSQRGLEATPSHVLAKWAR